MTIPKGQSKNPFHTPLVPSPELAAIVGIEPISRPQMIKKIWKYIKANNLQDKVQRRMINADDKLLRIFGEAQVSMFHMTKLLNRHLHPMDEE